MEKYILAIDQGTTSTRAIIFDEHANALFSAQKEVNCLYPKSGWVEQDPLEIWLSVIGVINELLVKANITLDNIDSIGITNQRETTVVWDRKTGMPVYNAIVWQSRQSNEICLSLEDKKDFIHAKTGLLINPYFSASKIRFILDHIENGQARAEKGELMFGTIDTWVLYKLTSGKVFATDVSNASRTLLYNIHELKWDDELLQLFNIPKSMLPEVRPSSYNFGPATFFGSNVNICALCGDQQSALFGQTCFEKGDSKNTYGTGCFMLLNTGEKAVVSKHGLLTTIAWQIKDKVYYALEGSVFIGGAIIQWLRDELQMIENSSESEDFALKVEDSNGVYIVPAFVGLGTPYWDNDVRGSVFGLTRGTNKHHFARAALEAIAYQCKDVIQVMEEESSMKIINLKVDGGATMNKYLMQFQSDILGCDISLPQCLETTALGVSFLAGLESGFFSSLDAIKKDYSFKCVYSPNMSNEESEKRYLGWKKAVEATRVFKL